MTSCWEQTRYSLAAFAQQICGASGSSIVPEKMGRTGTIIGARPDRQRNRHQSIIRLADTTESGSEVRDSGSGLNNFQSIAGAALAAFRRPKAEVQKALSVAVDPKAVAREAVVLVMVGLPARGKSYISGAVLRHLQLLGVRVRTFNAGELRRDEGKAGIKADFFSASNKDAKNERERLAMACCDSLLEWMRQAPPATSSVGILDATNTTKARRRTVLERCHEAATRAANTGSNLAPIRVIFVESICDSPGLLEGNYKMKLRNDDYKGTTDPEAALEDFRRRVQAYEAQYEPLEDDELHVADCTMPVGCVRIYNGGQKIVCCQTNHSIVAAPFISLLHAMHLTPRRVLLVPEAAGGGGVNDAQVLAKFLKLEEEKEGQNIDVILGASRHASLLAQQLELMAPSAGVSRREPSPSGDAMPLTPCGLPPSRPARTVLTLRALEPRSAGFRSGTDLANLEQAHESYADLVRRMRSEVLLLVERLPRSVLVVCPAEDVRRVLLAHFNGCNVESLGDMPLPEGKVVELTRDHKGFSNREVDLPKLSPSHAGAKALSTPNGTAMPRMMKR
mmetsp:Transcript_102977/g.266277  ORF Transcript_102977/g.266277 Transcript_102977/m.266277 type:complete len:564 (-) Transcript_102977:151-1842(-)